MSKLSEPLDAELVARKLRRLAGWTLHGERMLARGYTFDDFKQAVAFVNRVAEVAEAADHHPDIDIRYNRVILQLTTHDAEGLTEQDFALARECERLFKG